MGSPKTPTPLTCPDCQSRMGKHWFGPIEVDYCPKCRGVWFDRGEYAQVVRQAIPSYSASWGNRVSTQAYGPSLQCPRCPAGHVLGSYRWGTNPFERCPSCLGIFLKESAWNAVAIELEAAPGRQQKRDISLAAGEALLMIAQIGLE